MSGKGGRSYADMARRVMGVEQPESSGGFSVRDILDALSPAAQQQTFFGYDPSQGAANNITRSLLGAYNAVKTQPAPYDPQEFWRRANAGEKQDPRAWDNAMAVAGMMAGVGSKSADIPALNTAENLERAGANPNHIWQQTGWGRGADNAWRHEIDDSSARLRQQTNELNMKKRGDLGKSLLHDDLYTAYPDVANVGYKPMYGSDSRGTYWKESDAIGINVFNIPRTSNRALKDAARDQMLSTTLHETQHAVQGREGFARGGSPDNVASFAGHKPDPHVLTQAGLLKAAIDTGLAGNVDDAMKYLPTPEIGWQTAAIYLAKNPEKYDDAARRGWLHDNPYEAYRRLAGEVEARNVQTRQDMTPDERRAKPPWETEDVPRSQQILRK